jgi:hypothetical protein
MQKVVGSSPIIRFESPRKSRVFSLTEPDDPRGFLPIVLPNACRQHSATRKEPRHRALKPPIGQAALGPRRPLSHPIACVGRAEEIEAAGLLRVRDVPPDYRRRFNTDPLTPTRRSGSSGSSHTLDSGVMAGPRGTVSPRV